MKSCEVTASTDDEWIRKQGEEIEQRREGREERGRGGARKARGASLLFSHCLSSILSSTQFMMVPCQL